MAVTHVQAIVIGGSAGALDALSQILPALPSGFPLPIALVVHVLPGRPSHLAEVLGTRCALRVKEAEDKEPLCPGTIHIAPPNYHLLVERKRYLSLSVDDAVHFSRPAIDVLFESAADAYGRALLGLLLSGANEDGAKGLSCIRRAGGTVVVQSPETASSRAMPDAGVRLGSPQHVLPLVEIGPLLAAMGSSETARKEGR